MAALTIAHRRTRNPEAGQELIEFALVFPMLLLVMLGIIDFGLLFRNYEILTNAAREGARVAVLPGYSDDDVRARVTQYVTAGGLNYPGTVTTTPGAVQNVNVGGSCIAVRPITVSYPHTYLFLGPIVGLFGGGSFTNKTLTATSSMRSEIAAAACP